MRIGERRILAALDEIEQNLAGPHLPWLCVCGRRLPLDSAANGLCPECSTVANA